MTISFLCFHEYIRFAVASIHIEAVSIFACMHIYDFSFFTFYNDKFVYAIVYIFNNVS